MPQVTYANQRIINIHRERATSDFLGIKNSNWMAASRALGAHALRLYLYLAANRDGYVLALSPAAIQEAIGMPVSTYRDQFRKLQSMGYIRNVCGNTYDFFEVPVEPTGKEMGSEQNATPVLNFEEEAAAADKVQLPAHNLMQEDGEINNMDNHEIQGTINNFAAASSRVQQKYRADEIWPIIWDGYVDNPALMLTEEEAREIEREQHKNSTAFVPPKGEFTF